MLGIGKKKTIILASFAEVIHCPDDIDLIIIDPYAQGEGGLPAVCYQPEYHEEEWCRVNFASFMVYRNKCNAQAEFPRLRIIEYKRRAIEEPIFIDAGR